MSENRYVATVLQVTVTASVLCLITHAAFSIYDKLKAKTRGAGDGDGDGVVVVGGKNKNYNCKKRDTKKTINEVIFVNERTFDCSHNHKENDEDDISEVIFTNEKSQQCKDYHIDVAVASVRSIRPMRKPTLSQVPGKCVNPYCTQNNLDRIIDLIDKVQYSIDIAMYVLTQKCLTIALANAVKRGVNVRFISDKEMTRFRIDSILKGGKKTDVFELRYNKTGLIMHHKFAVLDGPLRCKYLGAGQNITPDQSILINGSLNWTKQGTSNNYENCIITSNQTLVTQYEEEFQRMWEVFETTEKKVA